MIYSLQDRIKSMSDPARSIAQSLLKTQAVTLSAKEPYTWASGLRSPIYCDNRKTLSDHEARSLIADEFVKLIHAKYPDTQAIAGVATAGIPQATLVADRLKLPLLYVRPEPKDHGRKNQIEGNLKAGQKVVVIEDLISTGGSSIKAAQALQEAGAVVQALAAVFTYGLPKAEANFKNAGIAQHALSNYEVLIEEAANSGYISTEEQQTLQEWRRDPQAWSEQYTAKTLLH